MKNVIMLTACCLIVTGYLSLGSDYVLQTVSADKNEKKMDSGLSIDNPIVMKDKFNNLEDAEKYQRSYINEKFPECSIFMETFTMGKDNAYIHFFTIKTSENKFIQIYFDMTHLYKKLRIKNREARNKADQMEDRHKPLS